MHTFEIQAAGVAGPAATVNQLLVSCDSLPALPSVLDSVMRCLDAPEPPEPRRIVEMIGSDPTIVADCLVAAADRLCCIHGPQLHGRTGAGGRLSR